jgi:hypothetical protein
MRPKIIPVKQNNGEMLNLLSSQIPIAVGKIIVVIVDIAI